MLSIGFANLDAKEAAPIDTSAAQVRRSPPLPSPTATTTPTHPPTRVLRVPCRLPLMPLYYPSGEAAPLLLLHTTAFRCGAVDSAALQVLA